MKELTKEQLLQEMKEHKQQMQLNFVDDLLDRVEHLSNKTNRADYEPSVEERKKILKIKRYIDAVVLDLLEEHPLVKGKHEWDWFKYDESEDLEESIKYNIAVHCEQRLNGYYDGCNNELYDKEDWYKYIFDNMQEEWHQNGSIFVNDRIPKFTEIYGHDNVKALIKLWVDNYEDVKPYIKW